MQSRTITIAFIGVGQVNFGGGEGPWDHATRLEKICAIHPLACVGIADIDTKRAEATLNKRHTNSLAPEMWKNTQIFSDYIEMLDKTKPDAVFIGLPPGGHGSTNPQRAVELECAKRHVHMFIEKPLSCSPLEEVEALATKLDEAKEKGLVISVGYMFRYSKAVLKLKELIEKYGPPKAFNARYNCAYSTLSKPMWWDVDQSGGPIVEQATHFCDLARFLVGDVDLDSLKAIAIKQTDPCGNLNHVPSNINEDTIPPERRIPRVTTAFWKFKSGAIGTLMHGALLHEIKYESELEVWGDGYRLVLIEPYTNCKLAVRAPHSEETQILDFADDDYYYTEDLVFIEAVKDRSSPNAVIQSPYNDAIKTYQLTWAIKTGSL